MPVMTFDLEDGQPPVSFSINGEGAGRFMEFMAECQRMRNVAGKYEKFSRLRDEMGTPRTLGGTFYPKYSEREAFDLAAKDD